jgi:MIP family channel proteins
MGIIDSVDKVAIRAALAEFMASFFFVVFGAGSVCALGQSGTPAAPINYAVSFGLCITTLAFSIGNISGGHINPAVSLAMFVSGNLTPTRCFLYFVAQFAGAISGGGILKVAVGPEQYNGGIAMTYSDSAAQAFLIEALGTLLLLFVIFNTAVWATGSEKHSIHDGVVAGLAPLPIGFAVAIAHMFAGPFTGCGINPARVLGTSVWESKAFWEGKAGVYFWIYFAGPFTAALLFPAVNWLLHGHLKPAKHNVPEGVQSNVRKEIQRPTSAYVMDL